METRERWEGFYQGGRKVGLLWRRYTGPVLTSRICFPVDGGHYRAESVIRFDDSGTWVSSAYRQRPGEVDVAVDRRTAGLDGHTLPSYGEFLMIQEMIASGAEQRSFGRLDDADPSATPSPATLRWRDTETVEVDGRPQPARRLELLVDSVAAGAHWEAGGRLVKSDWNGAHSTPGMPQVVQDGLDATVVAFIRHGFGPTEHS